MLSLHPRYAIEASCIITISEINNFLQLHFMDTLRPRSSAIRPSISALAGPPAERQTFIQQFWVDLASVADASLKWWRVV